MFISISNNTYTTKVTLSKLKNNNNKERKKKLRNCTTIAGQFRFAMKGREVILQPGDMIEVPAGVVHNASVIGSESVVFFDATK